MNAKPILTGAPLADMLAMPLASAATAGLALTQPGAGK